MEFVTLIIYAMYSILGPQPVSFVSFLFATQTVYNLVGKTTFAEYAKRSNLAVAVRPHCKLSTRPTQERENVHLCCAEASPATAKIELFEESPPPQHPCPVEASRAGCLIRGRSVHGGAVPAYGDIGMAKPREAGTFSLPTPSPHALYGTRLCGPVLGGDKKILTYRETLTYDSAHPGPKGRPVRRGKILLKLSASYYVCKQN